MLDGVARRAIDPLLHAGGRRLAALGVTPNAVTLAAFALGIVGAAFVAFGHPLAGLAVMVVSRLCDGLDGAVAKAAERATDYGGYLDIVLDYVFYGAVPLAFVINDPHANGLAGAVLLFSFYANGASFLAYAIMAEKRTMTSEARGKKSLYFSTGLAEASETFIAFALFCLFPAHFASIAWIFAVICLYTAFSRIVLAGRAFSEPR
ncbi:CDP-alcohol phosphatidyltransferase family protein [Pararhizobium mangrovi]|uniref:CDP-alcohol phosphatidyltransferase family protein n=1 Tax=Pararhizobium mangrovi TaxID=2590452 RepID=A0A506TZ10_9HYPH|nr:CDP-alcohol phosphatidyltransferase family protein [Pararhizobium mangrovi]TPW25964.1 CDP-alcohol phosphatidyltransferase family protein [Pararhizobium mangrovi]